MIYFTTGYLVNCKINRWFHWKTDKYKFAKEFIIPTMWLQNLCKNVILMLEMALPKSAVMNSNYRINLCFYSNSWFESQSEQW